MIDEQQARERKRPSFFEGLDILAEPTDENVAGGKVYGVVTARVLPSAEMGPLRPGMVLIRLPFLDALDPVWARIAAPMASLLSGFHFMPNPDDEVLVAFEHGDVGHPVILGGLWNLKSLPPMVLPNIQTRVLRTPGGSQIVFTDLPTKPPTMTIQVGPTLPMAIPSPPPLSPATIELGPDGITMTVGGTTLSVTAAGIVMTSPNVSINGGATVSIKGAIVNIN